MEKTITVKSLNRTPTKGIIVKTMAGEEYKYTTHEVDEVLSQPGTVASITFDETKKITAAMKLAYTPDVILLAEKLEAAKSKTAEVVNVPVKTPSPKQIVPINKSTSLSYSKDLVIAGIINPQDLLKCAETFYLYTTGELTPEPLDFVTVMGATRAHSKGG